MWFDSCGCDKVEVGAMSIEQCDDDSELGWSWSENVMRVLWDITDGKDTASEEV